MPIKVTDTLLLKKKIEESGYKLSFIAQKLGISRYALAMKIDNKTEFLPSQINTLCKLLNIKSVTERMRIFFAEDVDKNSTR